MAQSGSRVGRATQILQIHAGPPMPGRAPHRVHHEPGGRLRDSSDCIPAGLAADVSSGRTPRAVDTQAERLAPRTEVRRAYRGLHGAALTRLPVWTRRMPPTPRTQPRPVSVGVPLPLAVGVDDGPAGPLGRRVDGRRAGADQSPDGDDGLKAGGLDIAGGETHGISARSGGDSRADPPRLSGRRSCPAA